MCCSQQWLYFQLTKQPQPQVPNVSCAAQPGTFQHEHYYVPLICSGQAPQCRGWLHLGGRGGGEGDVVVVGAAVVVVGAAVVVGVAVVVVSAAVVVVGTGVGGGGLQANTGFSTVRHALLLLEA